MAARKHPAENPEVESTPVESKQLMSEAEMAGNQKTTAQILGGQSKRTTVLHQVPEHSTEPRLPDETVTINGHTYLIKRGEEVDLPEQVYEVLRDAGRL